MSDIKKEGQKKRSMAKWKTTPDPWLTSLIERIEKKSKRTQTQTRDRTKHQIIKIIFSSSTFGHYVVTPKSWVVYLRHIQT